MKRKLLDWPQRYQAALRTHLKQGQQASVELARGLGSEALAAGLQTLDLAKLHEQTMVLELLPGCPVRKRPAYIRQAGIFFALAITPHEQTQSIGRAKPIPLTALVKTLSQRTVELAAANLKLGLEITRRKAIEKALRKKERHYSQVIKESARLQEQLRRLSRQILSAQEDERKEISRELHDMVAQTLTGINIRLDALKKEAALDTKGLEKNITRTQQLVAHSVNIVHQFARELRPAVLDDIGLIPALHSFMKSFTERTGVRTRLTAFAGVEQFSMARRTVLFRVAQEALTNVARHAQASRVEVSIHKLPECICMQVEDDGKSFQVQRVLMSRGSKRLGLLGMRERLEMVGGRFDVESAPGKGTTIVAKIPFGKILAPKAKKMLLELARLNPEPL